MGIHRVNLMAQYPILDNCISGISPLDLVLETELITGQVQPLGDLNYNGELNIDLCVNHHANDSQTTNANSEHMVRERFCILGGVGHLIGIATFFASYTACIYRHRQLFDCEV